MTLFGFSNCSATAQMISFEKSDGKESADYFEAINWYKSLSKKSSEIKIIEMGTTDAGRSTLKRQFTQGKVRK